VMNF